MHERWWDRPRLMAGAISRFGGEAVDANGKWRTSKTNRVRAANANAPRTNAVVIRAADRSRRHGCQRFSRFACALTCSFFHMVDQAVPFMIEIRWRVHPSRAGRGGGEGRDSLACAAESQVGGRAVGSIGAASGHAVAVAVRSVAQKRSALHHAGRTGCGSCGIRLFC